MEVLRANWLSSLPRYDRGIIILFYFHGIIICQNI